MRLKVTSKDHGKRLLQYLREYLPPGVSLKAMKRAIEQKQCRLNGRLERFSTVFVQTGDLVEIELSLQEKESVKLPVLYEDGALIIVDKPSGIPSEQSILCKLLGFPVFLVHRLDKETSGALILAKNQEAHHQMVALFEKKRVKKIYLALVKGRVKVKAGLIDTFFVKKGTFSGQSIWGSALVGLRAITRWRCIKRGSDYSVLLCMPITGRTHQLRVHLLEMRHPLIGDTQYGREMKCSVMTPRHLLHALRLKFPHPLTGKRVKVTAPLPPLFIPILDGASG